MGGARSAFQQGHHSQNSQPATIIIVTFMKVLNFNWMRRSVSFLFAVFELMIS